MNQSRSGGSSGNHLNRGRIDRRLHYQHVARMTVRNSTIGRRLPTLHVDGGSQITNPPGLEEQRLELGPYFAPRHVVDSCQLRLDRFPTAASKVCSQTTSDIDGLADIQNASRSVSQNIDACSVGRLGDETFPRTQPYLAPILNHKRLLDEATCHLWRGVANRQHLLGHEPEIAHRTHFVQALV